MRQDKKVERGRLTFILARGIGESFIASDVDEASVLAFLSRSSRSRRPDAPLARPGAGRRSC